jgi:hypothetical protein
MAVSSHPFVRVPIRPFPASYPDWLAVARWPRHSILAGLSCHPTRSRISRERLPLFIDKRESVKSALIRREHSIRGTLGRLVWGYLVIDTTCWCYSRNISEKEND